LYLSPFPNASFFLFFMILNLFCIMTGITPEMTGYQHPCCSYNKIASKCKKVDYPAFLLPPLFRNTWDCIRCKIAKRGDVNNQTRS
jgi:hypothetical protein